MGEQKEDFIKQIFGELRKLDYIRPEDIPDIDLYMDQVTTFMDQHLQSTKRYPDDKLLTKTMINNYTKNNLLPAPDRKKYSKEHILLLIFIYYFKNILSINDIQSLFKPLTEKYYKGNAHLNLEDIYKEVFSLEKEQVDILAKDVIRKYSKAKETFAEEKDENDRSFLTTFSFICMLSFDVYIKKMMIESIIDCEIMKKSRSKVERKEKKSQEKTVERK